MDTLNGSQVFSSIVVGDGLVDACCMTNKAFDVPKVPNESTFLFSSDLTRPRLRFARAAQPQKVLVKIRLSQSASQFRHILSQPDDRGPSFACMRFEVETNAAAGLS